MTDILQAPHANTPEDESAVPLPQPVQQPVQLPDEQAVQPAETLLESIASLCAIFAVGLFIMTFVAQNFEIPSASMVNTLLIGDHVMVDRIVLAPNAPWAFFMPYRDVRRGDIIVFFKPGEPKLFLVKRAIAIPGDRIHLQHGVVYLNGVAQSEPFVSSRPDQPRKPRDAESDDDPAETQNLYEPFRDDFPAVPPSPYEEITPEWAHDLPSHISNGDLVVPPGRIFAMGDNRTESLDGRFWGFVPRENIVGRPLFVYWSFRTPADQIEKQSPPERLHFFGHMLLHIFDQTRWSRTLHRIL